MRHTVAAFVLVALAGLGFAAIAIALATGRRP